MSVIGSSPTLINVTISENTADIFGGGIYVSSSDPTFTNVTINGNMAKNGGGMFLISSNPILTEVTISGNTAKYGGGLNLSISSPVLIHVTISGNMAYFDSTSGGGYGGGMSLSNESNPTLINVTINDNMANSHGGGIYSNQSHPSLIGVTIKENTSDYNGGGMAILYSNPILKNVTISGNTANNHGGGFLIIYSNPIQTNVTISENIGQGVYLFHSHSILTNSIIWGNTQGSIYFNTEGSTFITYCDIEGDTLWVGDGNINDDPLFNNPENGDFTLQEGSPCIDAGNPNTWETDPDSSTVDLGATGGAYVIPNFFDYEFLNEGNDDSIGWSLLNYRETPITIDGVSFSTNSFTTDTDFPLVIGPSETGTAGLYAAKRF